MNNAFSSWAMVCVFAFVASSMFSVGAALTVGDLVKQVRNTRLIFLSIVVSFVIVPLLAVVISLVLFLDEPYRIGLVLFSMAAGTEALPNMVHRVDGDGAFAVALMTVQILISLIFVPVITVLALPDVDIAIVPLLVKLFAIVFLPLLAGILVKAWREKTAFRLHKIFHIISNIFVVLVLIFLCFHGYGKILSVFGSRAILAGILLLSSAAVIGYFAGGPAKETRKTLSLGSCGRNMSIALLVASQAFSDPKVVSMVVVMALTMIVVFLPALIILKKS